MPHDEERRRRPEHLEDDGLEAEEDVLVGLAARVAVVVLVVLALAVLVGELLEDLGVVGGGRCVVWGPEEGVSWGERGLLLLLERSIRGGTCWYVSPSHEPASISERQRHLITSYDLLSSATVMPVRTMVDVQTVSGWSGAAGLAGSLFFCGCLVGEGVSGSIFVTTKTTNRLSSWPIRTCAGRRSR